MRGIEGWCRSGTAVGRAVRVWGAVLGASIGMATAAAAQEGGQSITLPEIQVADQGDSALPGRSTISGGPSGIKGYTVTAAPVATKTSTKLVDVPASVSVVTREELDDRNVQSLNDALAYTPGAFTNIYGYDPRFDAFYIRGFAVTYDGVYRDGLREVSVGNDVWHNEPYGFDAISILRGPAAALYGFGSPGGIVDITSKRPVFTNFGEVQLQVGNYERYQGDFDIGGPVAGTNGTMAYRVTGVFRDSNTYYLGARDDRTTIAPAFTYRPDGATTFTFLSEYEKIKVPGTIAFYNTANFQVTDIRYGDPAFNAILQEQYRVGYAFEHKFSEDLIIRQNFRYGGINSDDSFTTVDSISADGTSASRSAGRYFDNLQSVNLDNQVEAHLHVGPTKSTVLAGLDYTHLDYDRSYGYAFGGAPPLNLITQNYGLQPIASPPITNGSTQHQDQLGEYLQDQVEWQRFFLTLSGRHDGVVTDTSSFSYSGASSPTTEHQDNGAFTGRAGLNYKLLEGVYPYASYSTTFEPNPGVDASGMAFQPTRGDQKEAGLKTQWPGTNLHVNGAVFDIKESNILVQDPTSVANQAAIGKVESRGFELEAIDNIAPGTNFTVAYTHLAVRILDGATGTDGKILSGIPGDTVAAFATYQLPVPGALGGLQVGGGVRSFSTSFADDANTGVNKPVAVFDALLAYDLSRLDRRFKGVRAQVNATNVFDRYYTTCIESFCYRGAPLQVIGSLIYRW